MQDIYTSIQPGHAHQHSSNIICHIILHNNKTLKWFILRIWYPFKILHSPLCSTRLDEHKQILIAYIFKKLN
jgi:hypothetical protein